MVAVSAGFGRQVRTIGLVGSAHFFSHFYQLALPPLFPMIVTDLDVSALELGVAVTAYAVATFVLQTPVGFLIDRIGGRWLLIAGLAVNAAAFCAAGMIGTYWGLVAFMAVAGIGNSVFHPADYSILSASIEKSRLGRAFSMHSIGGTSGFAAAPLVMWGLAEHWDWRTALVIAGVAGLILAVVLLLLRESLTGAGDIEQKPADAASRQASGWRLLMQRPIVIFFLFFALMAAAGSGLNAFTVLALVEVYKVDLSLASGTLTAFLVMVAMGVLLGGIIADRTRRHGLVLFVTYSVGAFCLFLIGAGMLPFWFVVVALLLAGIMRGIVNPSRDILVRESAPPGSTGAVFAFITTGFTAGQSISPMFYGWLMDIGSPNAIFLLASGFMVAGLLLVAVTHQRKPPVRI